MPSPSTAITNLDPQLQPYAEIRFAELADTYSASRLLPVTNVPTSSGNFGKTTLEDFLRQNRDYQRAPDGSYTRTVDQFTQDTYATKEYGVESPIDDREATMYRGLHDGRRFAVDRCINALLVAAEKRAAALVMDVTTYSGTAALNYTTTNAWNHASGVPISDVVAAKKKFFANTAMYPNTLVMNRSLFDVARMNAQVVSSIHSSGAGSSIELGRVAAAELALVFDVDQVIVAGSGENTAIESAAATIAHIWPDYAFLCRVARTPDMQEPCIGRTFHWGMDGSRYGGLVDSYREEHRRAEIVRVRHEMVEKRLHVEMGMLIMKAGPVDLID